MVEEPKPYAKYHFRMIEALKRGYYVRDGVLYGPKGILKVKRRGKQRYPTFTTNWGGVQALPVHAFAALCYYGYKVFDRKLHVRHLNADTEDISPENIQLGTPRENEFDKIKSVRNRSAKVARAAQGKAALNRKLSDSDMEKIKKFYDSLNGKKAPNGSVRRLCDEIGVTKECIRNYYTGKTYAV